MSDWPDEEHERYARKELAMTEDQQREWEATRELVVVKPQSIVRAAVGDVTDAIAEYARIQASIDRALPDCIQTIAGKQFRKKSYWRAVATAFNLTLEIRGDDADEPDGGAWGYIVTYRAHAPNGRYADGDGACFASEKTDTQATVHNVRGHAHTRAMNRAISNLVGFGEVSAEEVTHEAAGRVAARKAQVSPPAKKSGVTDTATRPAQSTETISEPQRKRLWTIWSKRYEQECPGGNAESKEANLREILGTHGYEHTTDIKRAHYDGIVEDIEQWEIANTPGSPAWGGERR